MVESNQSEPTMTTIMGEDVKLTESLMTAKGKKEIGIKVCDPLIREDRMSKYIIYTIKGFDRQGKFESFRRYSDFNLLRNMLVNRWPGCYIPPIPDKKISGNLNPEFIEDRRKFLEVFLYKIADVPYLYYGDEFQTFIKSNVQDIEKALNNLPRLTYEAMIERYTVAFSFLSGKELNNDILLKIGSFYSYLKKVNGFFENFKKHAKAMLSAKKSYYELFGQFHQTLMCDYERNCMSELAANEDKEKSCVFNDGANLKLSNATAKIKADAKKESFELVYDSVRREHKEINAFIEAIQQKEKYEQIKVKLQEKQKSDTAELQKILAGKTTFKSLLSRKSKDEELAAIEKQIAQTTKEIDSVSLLLDLITLILSYVEIDKFKAEKVDNYYNMIAKLAKAEDDALADLQTYWQAVLSNQNLASI